MADLQSQRTSSACLVRVLLPLLLEALEVLLVGVVLGLVRAGPRRERRGEFGRD